jgi:hypothetical protein
MRDDEAVEASLLAGENHEHPAADPCFFLYRLQFIRFGTGLQSNRASADFS